MKIIDQIERELHQNGSAYGYGGRYEVIVGPQVERLMVEEMKCCRSGA